jgi:cobalamin biosynthetic protein CobC
METTPTSTLSTFRSSEKVRDHGGGLAEAADRFGTPAGGWIDLSTGINPWPYAVPALAADAWVRLPGRDSMDTLLRAATRAYGAPDSAVVLAAPGSQALIQRLPFHRDRCRVAVLGPTYAEHARCWRLAGHEVEVVPTLPEGGFDVVVATNPNNPDGRRLPAGDLVAFAAIMARRGGLLVVDEAFAEVTPEVSVAGAAGMDGLCVLRSFGKFYGLAGLRLGFALGATGLLRRLEADLGPWAVSGPAIEIGRLALGDEAWARTTRERLSEASAQLDALLAAHGLSVLGGTDLYRLVETDRAGALFEALGRRGILARAFDAHPRWLRFGLPPDAAASARLADALKA